MLAGRRACRVMDISVLLGLEVTKIPHSWLPDPATPLKHCAPPMQLYLTTLEAVKEPQNAGI